MMFSSIPHNMHTTIWMFNVCFGIHAQGEIFSRKLGDVLEMGGIDRKLYFADIPVWDKVSRLNVLREVGAVSWHVQSHRLYMSSTCPSSSLHFIRRPRIARFSRKCLST
jgi:hypothetical protein